MCENVHSAPFSHRPFMKNLHGRRGTKSRCLPPPLVGLAAASLCVGSGAGIAAEALSALGVGGAAAAGFAMRSGSATVDTMRGDKKDSSERPGAAAAAGAAAALGTPGEAALGGAAAVPLSAAAAGLCFLLGEVPFLAAPGDRPFPPRFFRIFFAPGAPEALASSSPSSLPPAPAGSASRAEPALRIVLRLKTQAHGDYFRICEA